MQAILFHGIEFALLAPFQSWETMNKTSTEKKLRLKLGNPASHHVSEIARNIHDLVYLYAKVHTEHRHENANIFLSFLGEIW